jgi:hypothetical protein
LIKGSGSISDKETEMLKQSQSILSTWNISSDALKKELTRIKGILRQNAGEQVDVEIMQGKNVIDSGLLGRDDIYSALQQGYQVNYL